jgi:hypothetical protein
MGRAFSKHGEQEYKPEGNVPLGRSRRKWEHNFKMDLREIVWGDVAQSRDQWGTLMNMVMNFWVL